MSGTETLLPFIKEKKQGDPDEPTIIVDSREASSAPKIVKGLIEKGVKVRTETLEKGDYILSDECAVERVGISLSRFFGSKKYTQNRCCLLKATCP
jgi:ERCC4-type nuclease